MGGQAKTRRKIPAVGDTIQFLRQPCGEDLHTAAIVTRVSKNCLWLTLFPPEVPHTPQTYIQVTSRRWRWPR